MFQYPQNHGNKIYLRPGEVYIADKPAIVWTLLGSCVSVTFFNPRLKIGAITHAQLPGANHGSGKCHEACPVKCMHDAPRTCNTKYVNCSIEHLLREYGKRGIGGDEIKVRLYGGASIFDLPGDILAIGRKNIDMAEAILKKNNLPLYYRQTGGKRGLSLLFQTDTGEVTIKDSQKINPGFPPSP